MEKTTLPIKDICIISIFTVMTVVMAQIAIPLPFTPVPISLGLVAVYMTGILLQPKHSVFAQVTYLLLGGVGLPVFANFKGGLGVLLGPTGGYLIVYPIMALLVAMAVNSKKSLQTESVTTRRFLYTKVIIVMAIALLILYMVGTIWFSITTHTPFIASLALAVFPFIPLDIIKIAFSVIIFMPFRKRLIKMGLLNLML
ncbi:biotin transporter BioY [bacterium]|nr:biotin transporter BioY [bacterium]